MTETQLATQPETNGSAPERLEVKNPATGEVIGSVVQQTPAEVAAAVERARVAQRDWQALGYANRARILRRAQKWTTENADRIARTIVSETGKTYEDAILAEVSYAAAGFGFWAKNAPKYLADEKVSTSNPFVLGRQLVVRYAPGRRRRRDRAVELPADELVRRLHPGARRRQRGRPQAGEPDPDDLAADARGAARLGLPEDVYQVVVGPGSTIGSALIDEVDVVMFTGSTEVGKQVMQQAGKTVTPVSLELGGKDPMIVLADADLERAANSAVYYSMQNGGQTCISIERVYAEAPIYDEFVAKVEGKMRELRQGVSTDPGTVEVGAITSPEQGDIVEEHVADAVEKGARVLVGGKRHSERGDFFEPTLLVDVDHSMKCMTEETFGPTLPVMKVADVDEAVRLANDSPFGLQSSVFTKDLDRGKQVARRIEAGVCCINDACINYVALELPMGGWKESGLGTRHGPGGIRKYTRQQTVVATRFAMKKEIHMYPYRRSVSNLIKRAVQFLYGRGKRD